MMTSRRARLVLGAVTLAVGGIQLRAGNALSQDSVQPTFRSSAAAVRVEATVRDSTRRPILGLRASDFEVFDNDVLQHVEDVSYGKLPIDVTVALDVSHSVTGQLLERLRRGVVDLMGDLGRDDRLKLVLFNMRVQRTIDFTTDVKAVEQAIRGVAASGATALLDAISVTLVSAADPDRRQLIVFFTDGGDTSSTTTPARLTAVAERTRGTVTFVVPWSRPGSLINPAGRGFTASGSVTMPVNPLASLFSTLARETGGSVIPVIATGPSSNLSAAFRRILDEFRSTYVLYYNARGVSRDGYHTLQVKVTRSGAVVQARRGYFGS